MSFFESLKNGNIIDKKTKKMTAYDEFVHAKGLKLKDNEKKVIRISPKTFEETETLIDILKNNNGIIVDFNKTVYNDSQRMLDYLCGAVYALGGSVEKIQLNTYIMTPKDLNFINNPNKMNKT